MSIGGIVVLMFVASVLVVFVWSLTRNDSTSPPPGESGEQSKLD